ncbi:MAG: hypothetical protein GY801_17980 [bacterium]|nr:hypothetical protein [bacterium]
MITNMFHRKKSARRHSLMLWCTLGLMLLASGCASSAPKVVGTYTPEDMQAKNLTPPSGKALVYFFYGRAYPWGNIEIALDGAKSSINGQMYIVWEVPADSHRLDAVIPGRSAVPKTTSSTVNAAAGSVIYYRLLAYVEEEGKSGAKPTLYRFAPMKNQEAKSYIDAYSLVSWFRDGQRVYYDDSRLRKPQPVERY